MAISPSALNWRRILGLADPERISDLVAATGHFSKEETAIAAELAREVLARGEVSGYRFLLAEYDSGLMGYSCYGRIPGTVASWDVYWIAVRPMAQRHGLGRQLMTRLERDISDAGGARVYIDTSARPQYRPTHAFYEACGYRVAAVLPDFYGPNDGKIIYCRVLGGS